MNKSQLLEQIIVALEAVHKNAVDATNLAHETATHGETVAENKYDTFGLEASYLAHGQAKRVTECEADLATYKKLIIQDFSEKIAIAPGAVIYLQEQEENKNNIQKILFLGPAAGGLKLTFDNEKIMIITPSAPLGKALAGRFAGEIVKTTLAGEDKVYKIITVK